MEVHYPDIDRALEREKDRREAMIKDLARRLADDEALRYEVARAVIERRVPLLGAVK